MTEHEGRFPRSVLKYPTVQKIGHPTSKPIDLVSWLVLTYTNQDDLVLDPFCGSGTTALACLKNKRNFIAIEREEEYCELARRRLNEYESNYPKLPIKLDCNVDTRAPFLTGLGR